jgi:hypothetical protein
MKYSTKTTLMKDRASTSQRLLMIMRQAFIKKSATMPEFVEHWG